MKIDNILLKTSKPTEPTKTESITNSGQSSMPKTESITYSVDSSSPKIPQENEESKIATVGIVFAVISVVLAVAGIVVVVFIFIKKRFSFKNDSSIHMSLMSQDAI